MSKNLLFLTILKCIGLPFFILGMESSIFAQDDKSQRKHLHHFFNARLLQPKEVQISISGNAKVGLFPELELGSQLTGYFFQSPVPNLAMKHRMFHGESFQTSFNSHSFYIPGGKQLSLGGLVSFHGIVTTLDLSPTKFLNFGIYDLYMYLSEVDSDESARGHIFSPMIGYDWYITPRWHFSAVLVQPVYAILQANTDFGDMDSELDLLSGGAKNSRLFFITTVISWNRFSMEPGIFGVGGSTNLYLNLFWRFYAW